MTVYLAILDPDFSWDHYATLYGVYSTREQAEARMAGVTDKRKKVVECIVDEDRDPRKYL